MKRTESNPLLQELARDQLHGSHPDSDQIAAFGEGALLPREREELLAHMAVCAECREVLSMAAGAEPVAKLKAFIVPLPAHQITKTWLPWASIAAGVLAAVSGGLIYHQNALNRKPIAVALNEPAPVQSTTMQQSQLESAKKSGERPAAKEETHPSSRQSTQAAEPLREDRSQPGMQTYLGQQNSIQNQNAGAGQVAMYEHQAPRQAASSTSAAFANVAAASPMSNAFAAVSARPHWRINSAGQPERSFGGDVWQAVLPDEGSKMLVVSVFGGQVWVGGENSRLYRSTDNGNTWNLVALPTKGGSEHVILHIHFLTPQAGTVESEDGTQWATSDAGITWK